MKKHLESKICDVIFQDYFSFEIITVSLIKNDVKFLISCVYIPPWSKPNSYLEYSNILDELCESYPDYQKIFIGDFNLPKIKWIKENYFCNYIKESNISKKTRFI